MKKSFLSLLFFFITLISFAQGIAVQGIARDNVNSAISNKTLVFKFFIVNDENSAIFQEVQSINTDNFGIFSHVIGTGTADGAAFNTVDFSIENLKLKVVVNHKAVDIEVYNQPFHYVPYAHFAANAANAASAANGVPTGAIMPFIGGEDDVPAGWLLCDGRSIPNNTANAKLRELLGSDAKTPYLTGRFLKGTGTPTELNVESIPLKGYQNMKHTMPNHAHEKGSLKASTSGSTHKHAVPMAYRQIFDHDTNDQSAYTGGNNNTDTKTDGAHEHAITGETGAAKNYDSWYKNSENRPSSYGVNYIIKL